jgi:ribosomal protein L21E
MAMSRANMNQQITKPGQMKKVGTVMREFKKGELHSGKKGPVVKNPKQAVAIALSEARKVKKAVGGMIDGCAIRGRTRG